MNIVHFDQYRKTGRSFTRDESLDLLRQCRTQWIDQLDKVFSAMMVRVDDALFEMSEKDESVQSAYFEAMRELRQRRQELQGAFTRQLSNSFSEALIPFGFKEPLQKAEALELALVDVDEHEESVAIQEMTNKLEMLCHEELNGLNYRVAALVGEDVIELAGNPVSPARLCEAFRKACADINVSVRVKLVIFKLFDRHVVSTALQPIYHALNKLLINHDVVPELPQAERAVDDDADDDEVFSQLQKLIVGNQQPMTQGQAVSHENFMASLSAAQQGSGDGVMAHGIRLDPAALVSGLTNVVRQLQEQGAGSHLGQADSTTIDVVAMLFDYILDDKNLPDAMKAQIGRLQIPVLKVALSDKKFFARRRHPARQLLNVLAHASIGWDETLGHDDAMYLKVEETVVSILDHYEDDVVVFQNALDGFEAFLTQEQREEAKKAEAAARLAQSSERLQGIRHRVTQEIEQRLQPQVPGLVRDFINTHWRSLLMVTGVKQGDGSLEWKRSLVVMDNLIWSVTPKTADERTRLIKMLPSLLQNLSAGMEFVSMPQTERDNFLAQLAGCHGAVVNASSQVASQLQEQGSVHDYLASPGAPAPTPPVLAEAAEEAEQEAIQQLVDEGDVTVEEVTLSSTLDDGGSDIDIMDLKPECVAQAEGMKVGDWLEMKDEQGERVRAKLTWRSPVTGRYLFTNRKGLKVAEHSLQSLAAGFQCGDMTLLDDSPMLERAVSTVMQSMSA